MQLIAKLRKLVARPVGLASSKSTTKHSRHTKNAQAYRTKVFDDTLPHYGDDLIAALEYENFMRKEYKKHGKANIYR